MCKEKIYSSMLWNKGQVWLVREPESVTDAKIKAGTHLMVKTRPYLIYMAEESSLMRFNVVQGFPISSNDRFSDEREKSYYDFDIRFRNQEGNINRIITGQLMSIDVRYLAKYLFTLPSELMDEIDELMAKRFGIGGHLVNLEKRIQEMSAELEAMKGQASELFHQFNYESDRSGSLNPISLREENQESSVITQAETLSIDRTEKGRIRWSDTYAAMFLQHCKEKTPAQISTLWGIPAEKIAQTKFYCKKKLGGGALSAHFSQSEWNRNRLQKVSI